MSESWVAGRFPEWWPFTRLPNVMLRDPSMTTDAKVVWMLLCDQAYEQRTETPAIGVEEARAMLGLGERTWTRACKELRDRGLLTVKRRGVGLPNLYTVHLSEKAEKAGSRTRRNAGSEPAETQVLSMPLKTEEDKESLAALDSLAAEGQNGPPKVTKIDGRDLAWDALVEVCKIDPRSPRQGDVARALNGRRGSQREPGIRRLFWQEVEDEGQRRDIPDLLRLREGERFEQALAVAIKQRAVIYERVMGGAMLTPTALAKWWTDVPRQAMKGKLSGEEIMDIARQYERRSE